MAPATVESAATSVEAAAATVDFATTERASSLAMSIEAVAIVSPIAAVAPITVAPVSRASIEPATEPRAGTYEDAAGEPARTIVAVGSTRVRVIWVVPIGANRSWTDVARADSYSHDNPLRVGVRCDRQANAE